jgi:hypothetical protein
MQTQLDNSCNAIQDSIEDKLKMQVRVDTLCNAARDNLCNAVQYVIADNTGDNLKLPRMFITDVHMLLGQIQQDFSEVKVSVPS